MKKQSKYYHLYRFNDGTRYKVEIGKDGVSEESMRKLRRINNRENKINEKVDQLETISLEAIISGEDKHSVLTDECVDTELLIETAVEYETLHKAIGKLKPEQQELIHQIFFEGISQREMGRRLNVDEKYVRKMLRDIYKIVKICL